MAYRQQMESPIEQMSFALTNFVNMLFEPMDGDESDGRVYQQQARGPPPGRQPSAPSGLHQPNPSQPAPFGSGAPPQGPPGSPSRQVSMHSRPMPNAEILSPRMQSRQAAPSSPRQAPQGQRPPSAAPDRRSPPAATRMQSRPNGQQFQQNGPRTYNADADDLLDQHVAYYFRHHPQVYARHRIARKRPGVYELNGREIGVEWQYGLMPGEQGFLVALDGPLRQPFADYMSQSEANAEYVSQGLATTALNAVPLPSRMTFDDANRAYTRLEAMKVAKEQALVREKAAEYSQMGMAPPGDLRTQYEKTINRKLNPGGSRQHRPQPAPGPPPVLGGMPPMAAGYPMAPPSPMGVGMPMMMAGGSTMRGASPMPMMGGPYQFR